MEGITTVTTGYNQLSSHQPHWQLIGNDHTELQSQLVVVTHHIKLQDIIFNVENPKIRVKAIGPNQPNPLPVFTCGITTNSSLDSPRGNYIVGVFGPPMSKFVFTRLARMVCSEDTRVYTGSDGTSYVQFAAARVTGTWFAVGVTNRRERGRIPSLWWKE